MRRNIGFGLRWPRPGGVPVDDEHGAFNPRRVLGWPCRVGWVLASVLASVLIAGIQGRADTPLVNGGRNVGEINPATDVDIWTLTAKAGDALIIRIGTTNFTPRIQLHDPTDAVVGTTSQGNGFGRDDVLVGRATNAGVYRVFVDGKFGNQTGTYGLYLADIPGTFDVPAGDGGGDLPNGVMQGAELTLGDLDTWTFAANAGDALMLRVGSTNFTPWLQLYGPGGGLVGEAMNGNGFSVDDWLNLTATNTGTYTLVVMAKYLNQSGSYGVNLARVPGSFVVAPGDEGGALVNGVSQPGNLVLGDLDLWTFSANAGDALMLRLGATNFTPWLRLFAPDGTLVSDTETGNGFGRDEMINVLATNAGTYTLVVNAKFAGQTGPYALNLAQVPAAISVAPGDESGPLVNGVMQEGQLPLGDLDLWSFAANTGDAILLRMGSVDITPWLRLFGPDGVLVSEAANGNGFTRDDFLSVTATQSGTYTLVVGAKFLGQSGSYQVNLAQVPRDFTVDTDDEGGGIPNAFLEEGEVVLGDMDLWKFTAAAGESVMVRIGTTDFTPWLRLYGPTGVLVDDALNGNGFGRDDFINTTATNAGVYTLVVAAKFAGQLGPYELTVEHAPEPVLVAPGDEGGALTNGATNLANLNLGDLDVWSFIGTTGDSNVFRVTATNFTPWIRLFGPDGALLKETTTGNAFARNGLLNFPITNSGLYTLVLSATFAGQSGGYSLKQSRISPDLVVPAHTVINETELLSLPLSAQDPDDPDKIMTFGLLKAPMGMVLTPNGPTNATLTWQTTEADGPGTNDVVATVTDFVGGKAYIRTNTFQVIVNEVNRPPSLTVPGPQTLDEQTPLVAQATATDPDQPPNPLSFTLLEHPAGLSIDAATGQFTWVPEESQGPGNYTVTVVVTDDNPHAVNDVHLSTTNSFSVTVREVNLPPVLAAIPPQVTADDTVFHYTAHATDADVPANLLTYTLGAGAPAGATIDGVTGVISWPIGVRLATEVQPFTVRVTDNGVPPMQAEQSFQVTVVPPILRLVPVPEQHLDETTLLTLRMAVTNSPLAQPPFTFALVGAAPDGVSLNAVTGVLFWRPSEAQGPTNAAITVRVTDSASPANTTNVTFNVVVREVNLAPVIGSIPTQNTVPGALVSLTVSATDDDIPVNHLTYSLDPGAPAGMTLQASTGVLSWTVPGTAAGTTIPVTVRVKDDGSPVMEATRTFNVVVAQPAGLKLGVELLEGPLIRLRLTGEVGQTYLVEFSSDLRAWNTYTNFVSTATVTVFDEVQPLPAEQRFYRAIAP